MPKGQYDRTHLSRSPKKALRTITRATAIDRRSVFSLLPGRMIAKQLIEQELDTIRGVLKSGHHREYVALLPGLELELRQINDGLSFMAGAVEQPRHEEQPPAPPPPPPAPEPLQQPATVNGRKLLTSSPASSPSSSPRPNLHSKIKYEGTHNDILLQEIEAADGQFDAPYLHKKYKTTSRYTFHWCMDKLKKRGYEFRQLGTGIFQLTGVGKASSRSKV